MPFSVYRLFVTSQGASDLKPLLAFLRERNWRQRVTTFDQYGGMRMSVMLEPPLSPNQLRELTEHFVDAYEFTSVTAHRQ